MLTAFPVAAQHCCAATLGSGLVPAVRADDPPQNYWELVETQVNPANAQLEFVGGGADPTWFAEPRFEGKYVRYSVSETSCGVDDRSVDHGYEYHNVQVQVNFDKPPPQLTPGETVELAANFSHGGTAEDAGVALQFWYDGDGVYMEPDTTSWYSPWHEGFDGTSTATYSFEVPQAYYDGEEFVIHASLWNIPPCHVAWKYRTVLVEDEKQPEGPKEEPTAAEEDERRKPVIVLPGIYGSYLASTWDQKTWIYNRGLDPSLLTIDPLAHFYDDIIVTLKNAGYEEGRDLFIGAYDWRMPPGPFDGAHDGVIQGISGLSITDDRYEYGVDYLGYNLKLAAERWRQDHDGEILDSVDIISHSTGGLVARAYIQSTAYGGHFPASDGEGIPLPRVNNFIMVAVPNRGAALPWQAMNNNFIRDFPSKYVMAKILAVGWAKVLGGYAIEGAPAPITAQSVTDPATGQPDPVRFISQYCPTFRSLLATYPFLIDLEDNLVSVSGMAPYRNDLVLDLNNGLDLPGQPAPADPSPFANAVNHTVVFYASREATAHQVQEMNTASENVVFPMDAIFEQDMAQGTIWYRDIVDAVGDGTVPSVSAMGQFEGDGRIEIIKATDGNTTHTGLMANRQVQTGILDVLGIDWRDVEISTGLAYEDYWNVYVAATDPVGLLLVDGQGRRLGWTSDTGALAEMPNSVWYGEGDGFGVVYGEVPQPVRVELVGLGDDHTLQVVGKQGDQAIGLEDNGTLASGETRSLQPEVRPAVNAPSVTASQASDSDDLVLIGVIVVLYALIALVLVAIILTVVRRRRRRR
jgi:hypothetical protein